METAARFTVFLFVLASSGLDTSLGDTAFFDSGYVHVNSSMITGRLKAEVQFKRQGTNSDQVLFLFYSADSYPDYFAVVLRNGQLMSILKFGDVEIVANVHSELSVPALRWHRLVINLRRTSLTLKLPDVSNTSARDIQGFNKRSFPGLFSQFYLGGIPEEKHGLFPDLPTFASFQGCMRSLQILSTDVSFHLVDENRLDSFRVKSGNCCAEASSCSVEQARPVTIPSGCPLSRFNFSWSEITVIAQHVQVSEGGQTVLDADIFTVDIQDNDAQVWLQLEPLVYRTTVFHLETPPRHGSLRKNQSAEKVEHFDYETLTRSSIFYSHDGSETTQDSFAFQLNITCEGYVILSRSLVFQVIVQPQNDAPLVSQLSSLRLAVGTRRILTPSIITVTDPDSDPGRISFEVGMLESGRFEKVGRAGERITQFFQEDLFNGTVAFQHTYSKGAAPFTILVIISDGISTIFEHLTVEPYVAAIDVVNRTCLKVIEGSTGTLRLQNLGVTTNFEDHNPEVLFTLQSVPSHGVVQIRLASLDLVVWQTLTEGDSFSRQDIQLNGVRYLHNSSSYDAGLLNTQDWFNVTVTSYEAPGPSVHQCIEVIPRSSLEQSHLDLVTRRLNLTEGGYGAIGPQNIEISLLPASLMEWLQERGGLDSIGLRFSITVPPKHGSITLNEAPLDDTFFSLSDIRSSLLVYHHNGSEEHSDELAFLVEATEIEPTDLRIHPPDAINGVLPIFIAPVNNHRPVVETQDITPLEGGSQIVDRSVLSITDLDKPGDVIWVTYERNQYDNGYFAFVSNISEVVTKFTAEDVQAGRVIFHHRFGDVLTRPYVFTITDGENSLQKEIKVRASPLTLNVSIADDEGSTCPFMFDADKDIGYRLHPESFIVSTNAPGRRPDIKITVLAAPQYGYLQLESARLRESSVFEMRRVDSGDFLYILRNRTIQTNQDRFSLQFELGSATTVLDVPICIDPVPVPELENVYGDLDSLRLRVPVNGIQVITKDLLQATDSRGGLFPGCLEYDIAIPPQYGSIVNRSQGEKEVDKFTQMDINSQHIAYLHDQSDNREMDYFTFKLRNKYFTLAPVGVTVDLYHTNLSVTNNGFAVTEGARHVVTTDELFVSAPPGYSLYVAIVTPPLHGVLLYGAGQMPLGRRLIVPSALSSGLLSYMHDSSESRFDSFVFEVTANVTDPVTRNMYAGVVEHMGNFLGVVNVTVNLINDNPPEPHITSDLIVWEGSIANINTSILSYRDKDIDYNTSNLNYTINVVNPNFRCGHLYLQDRPDIPVTSFLQADLEASRLWYRHDRTKQCIDSGRDSIQLIFYTVSDGGLSSSGILTVNIVSFIITTVNEGLTLDEGEWAVIPPSGLSASVQGNEEISPSAFLFIITRPPRHGVLMVGASPLEGRVSLEEINQNRLSYVHNGSDTIEDTFRFDVTVNNFTESDQTFAISILPVDDTPPSVQVLKELRVLETGKGYLSRLHLRAEDSEQPDRLLTFFIVIQPHYGTVYRELSPYRSEGVYSFSQDDINREVIFYENTMALPNWRDNFTVTVTDGRNLLEELIKVDILLMPKTLPILTKELVVSENGLRVIRTENLMVGHPVYVGMPTKYTVTRQPDFGVLHSLDPERHEDTITTFTQASIDSRFIVYAHQGREPTINDEIRLKAISTEDSLSSGEFSLLVRIIPVNDEKPILSNPYPNLLIWNGDTVYLNDTVIRTTDEDNPPEELIYTFNLTAEMGLPSIGHFAWSHDHRVPIHTFSQGNITGKEVIFIHSGQVRNATLPFNVSDGTHITNGSLTVIANPITIIVTRNVAVVVKMEESVGLLLHNLEAMTNDGREHVITYTVTAACQYGQLLRDGSEVLGVGSNFTQDDIDSKRIAYRHTDMNRWERNDRFHFQVYVQHAVQPQSGTFAIIITLRQSISSDQPVIMPLLVVEGGHTCINESHLDARNLRYEAWKNHNLTVSIESLKISYRVTTDLRHGKLGLRGRIGSNPPASDSVNIFEQDDTEQSYSCYFHDGSDSIMDGFKFEVDIFRDTAVIGADSLFHSSGDFDIQIEPVNDERPVIDAESSLEIVIVEGFVGGVTNNQLQILDPDTPPEDLVFEISESPSGVQLLLVGREEVGMWRFTQADINNGQLILLHDGLSQEPVQFSFQFTDGNESHVGNGIITIVIVPRQLNFTGTAHLVYQQDAERVLISTSVLDVWTNAWRDETTITVDGVPTSGVIRKNLSSEAVGLFLQTDIDNGLLFYYPTNVSAIQDSFALTLVNGRQRIHQTVKVTVMSRMQSYSVTLSSSLNTLNYILPDGLFHIPDASSVLDPHITVMTNPRYGKLSKQAKVAKRQLTEVFDFSYSDLQTGQVLYTVNETLQNATDYTVKETFEALVQMMPGGQLGALTVEFAVEVSRTTPPPVPPTVTQDPLGTGDVAATTDNTLIVIPVLGVVIVLVVVIGVVAAAMLARYHRLRERERRRRERKVKEQKNNQSNEAGRLSPPVDYTTPNAEDSSSESTIDGDVTATEKQFPPPQTMGTHSETSFVFPYNEQNGVDNAGLPPYSQQPIPVPLPEKLHRDLTSVYSQGGSPRRGPSARAAARKKFGLTYNTAAVDSDVKKLFRSDYPQLKHVEYWV